MNRAPHICLLLLLACPGIACVHSGETAVVRVIDGKPQASRFVSPTAYNHYLRSQVHLNRGKLPQAIKELRQALIFDPRSPYLHTKLADALRKNGDLKEAMAHLDRALGFREGFPEALLTLGQIFWTQKKIAEAKASLGLCIQHNPLFVDCYLAQVTIMERLRQHGQARGLLHKLLSRVKDSMEGHQRMASLCLRLLDYPCAAKHLGRAVKHGWHKDTLLSLAHIHQALGHTDKAIGLYRKAFDRSGGQVQVAASLLEVLQQAGQVRAVDDLLWVLAKAAGDDPGKLERVITLALRARRPATALALLARAAPEDGSPKDHGSLAPLLRAEALYQQGKEAQAERLLARTLPRLKHAKWALRMARIYQQQRRHAQAQQALRSSLKHNGQHPGLMQALARSLGMVGKDQQAVDALRRALAMQPQSEALRFGLALSLEQSGQWKQANAEIRRLLARHPESAAAHNFIGYSLVEHGGNLAEAEQYIRRALFLDPGQGFIIDSLGWLTFKQGKPRQALRLLRMAVRLAPRDVEGLEHLAAANEALNSLDRAALLLQQAISLSVDGRVTTRLRERLKGLKRRRMGIGAKAREAPSKRNDQ